MALISARFLLRTTLAFFPSRRRLLISGDILGCQCIRLFFALEYLGHVRRAHVNWHQVVITLNQVTIRIICLLHLVGSVIGMSFEVFFTSAIVTHTHFKCSVHCLPTELLLQIVEIVVVRLVRRLPEVVLRQLSVRLARLHLGHLDFGGRACLALPLPPLLLLFLAPPARR